MPQDRPATPEKQLLNLIEKPMEKKSLHAAAIRYQGMSLLSLGALKGRFAFLKNRFSHNFKSGSVFQFDIKAVNLILKVIVFILSAYLFVNIITSALQLRQDLKIRTKVFKAAQVNIPEQSSLLKPLSGYVSKARERDIFARGPVKDSGDTQAFSRGPSQKIIEATQGFKLVGISWSDDPDVMIEDTKNQRTLFLKKGQMIDNEIRVQAVFKDKVILSLGKEEIELR